MNKCKTSKIFLIGLPGSGKTTCGRKLAGSINFCFFDLDDLVIQRERMPIVDIFKKKGETYFRKVERHCLLDVLPMKKNLVLASGGGTPCFFDNMDKMKNNGVTIFLNPPLATIKARLINDNDRPLLKENKLAHLYHERKIWYKKADFTAINYEELLQLLKIQTKGNGDGSGFYF